MYSENSLNGQLLWALTDIFKDTDLNYIHVREPVLDGYLPCTDKIFASIDVRPRELSFYAFHFSGLILFVHLLVSRIECNSMFLAYFFPILFLSTIFYFYSE